MNKRKELIFILLALMGGIFFRFWKLGQIPSGFYVDEASIGYNAWSILKTGKDEFGKAFPVLFRSFTVFGAPIYGYLLIPIYFLLGMTVFSTRLLSAVSGLMTIYFLYLLIVEASKFKKIALVSCLLLAFNPWHIMYSRTAYETNIALTFLLASLWMFYKSRKNINWIYGSGTMASLAVLSYPSQRIIVPLIFLCLVFLNRQWLFRKENKLKIILTVLIGFIMILPLLLLVGTPGFSARLDALSIMSEAVKKPYGFRVEYEGIKNIVLNNKFLLIVREWLSLYFSYFSPRYLFNLGDQGGRFSFVDLSPVLFWQFPFWLIGLFKLVKRDIKSELSKLVWLLLLICPIPASITRDPFSTIRSLPVLLPHIILIAVGMENFIRKNILVFYLLLLVSAIQMYLSIFVTNDRFRCKFWNCGVEAMVCEIKKYNNMQILVDDTWEEYYAHLLFFLKSNPKSYQQENLEVEPEEYYQNMNRLVSRKIGNIFVRQLDWRTDIMTKQLIVGGALSINDDQIKEHCLEKKFEILDDDGSVLFLGVETNPDRKEKMGQVIEGMIAKGIEKEMIVKDCNKLLGD